MSPELQRVRVVISDHLDQIARLFKNPKITLVVRIPDIADADVILTTEGDLADAVAAIEKLQRGPRHEAR